MREAGIMRLLLTGGGTAGHINPAIAIANCFCQREDNVEIMFIGTAAGLETELVPHAGYDLELIKIHGFDRSLTFKNFKNVCELIPAIRKADKIIKKFKPDVVVGTGGYVSGPVLYAAAKRKIPTLVHESNAFPGITTKILSNYVDKVALGVEDAKKFLKKTDNTILTGTPVRPSLLGRDQFEARRELSLDKRPFIVIFGGSLGARDFNKALADWIATSDKIDNYQILMGTGKANQYQAVMDRLKENGVNIESMPNITINEYIYNMDVAMNAADVVISRAGASTLCELTALGKPAILVPSPYVTDNHQEYNARAVENAGGAKVILEKDFNPDTISGALNEMLSGDVLAKMKKSSKAVGHHAYAIDVLYREIKGLTNK